MIKISNLKKSFHGVSILKGVDLEVEEGTTVALIGPSGSGKSTLLRCINLLETPEEGEIFLGDYHFNANNINNKVKKEVRQKTAMVFQGFYLFENKTALQNVTEALRVVKKIPKAEAEQIGEAYLKKVGMLDWKNNYPAALSGGQKQRVAIARALALKPQIILFDEPTSALDPERVQEVLTVIKKISKEDVTILLVTHEMDFAREVADKIVFMEDGNILEAAPTKEFFMNPKEERTRQFLSNYLQGFSYSI